MRFRQSVVDRESDLWLIQCDKEQPIKVKNIRKRVNKIFRLAGLTKSQDAMRHTYATMHLDHFRDKALLNTEMGHTDDRMMAHYQGLTKGIKSDQFWQIVPPDGKLVVGL